MTLRGLIVGAVAVAGIAHAQQPPSESGDCGTQRACEAADTNDRLVYDSGDFLRYNPRTALDMVRQVPGFTLESGADDRRGFSGAVGNVLIDGLRPSSKSQTLEDILSRIPFDQVVRMELLRGAEVAGDASGQAVLLNVVRTPTAGGGVWEGGVTYTSRDVPAPRGQFSFNGRAGQVEYGFGVTFDSDYRTLVANWETTDTTGALVGTVETSSPRDTREGNLTASIALPLAGGRLSANGQVSGDQFRADDEFLSFDSLDAPAGALRTTPESRDTGMEFGLNYENEIAGWSLALIGLLNQGRSDFEEFATTTDAGGVTVLQQSQDVEQDTSEMIVRATAQRPLGRSHNIELGAEGALNSLDQTLTFTRDTGGGPVIVPIANSNVLIEETRAEVFAAHAWRPRPGWSVESRVAWETSTLTFTGDSNQTVDLSFWKPSVQVTRTFGGGSQARIRVYREVGQLDFNDFVSAAEIADNLVAGGNPDLSPASVWRAELGWDMRFAGGAALGLTLRRHWYEDVVDLVTVTPAGGDPFDAPGNIGEAEATSVDVDFSTPLSPLVPGGRLTLEGTLWDTEVSDPLTGRPRILSGRSESLFMVQFRQDVSAWRFAWGFGYFKEGEAQAYRFNEIDTTEDGPWLDAFVETTALPNGLKLRLDVLNLAPGTIDRTRRFFGPPDRTGPFLEQQVREQRLEDPPFYRLRLSGTF